MLTQNEKSRVAAGMEKTVSPMRVELFPARIKRSKLPSSLKVKSDHRILPAVMSSERRSANRNAIRSQAPIMACTGTSGSRRATMACTTDLERAKALTGVSADPKSRLNARLKGFNFDLPGIDV